MRQTALTLTCEIDVFAQIRHDQAGKRLPVFAPLGRNSVNWQLPRPPPGQVGIKIAFHISPCPMYALRTPRRNSALRRLRHPGVSRCLPSCRRYARGVFLFAWTGRGTANGVHCAGAMCPVVFSRQPVPGSPNPPTLLLPGCRPCVVHYALFRATRPRGRTQDSP